MSGGLLGDTDDDGYESDPRVNLVWRAVSAVLGGLGLTFGTLAVFKTEVEAGPVALIVVGLLFTLIAIAGEMPWRIKIGESEIELRRERRRRATSEAVAIDLAATVDPKVQPEALEVIEQAESSNPSLALAMRDVLGYESEVLRRIAEQVRREGGEWVTQEDLANTADLRNPLNFKSARFDGLLAPTGVGHRAFVEVKATVQQLDRAFIEQLAERFERGRSQWGADHLLLVSRQYLTSEARERLQAIEGASWVLVDGGLSGWVALEQVVSDLLGV